MIFKLIFLMKCACTPAPRASQAGNLNTDIRAQYIDKKQLCAQQSVNSS